MNKRKEKVPFPSRGMRRTIYSDPEYRAPAYEEMNNADKPALKSAEEGSKTNGSGSENKNKPKAKGKNKYRAILLLAIVVICFQVFVSPRIDVDFSTLTDILPNSDAESKAGDDDNSEIGDEYFNYAENLQVINYKIGSGSDGEIPITIEIRNDNDTSIDNVMFMMIDRDQVLKNNKNGGDYFTAEGDIDPRSQGKVYASLSIEKQGKEENWKLNDINIVLVDASSVL